MTLRIGMSGKVAVTLPAEAVTQTVGIVAVRGAGKTNTSVVMTEEMIGAGSQVVVLDPLDVWWGLRASADGKGAGLPVYVFGGEHADLPLDAAAGKIIADTVIEQGINCVMSMRHLSKSAQRRFVADFAERLYDRKGESKYQTPLHLVIDEADAFAPQRVMADTARMLGAIDDCVRRGRNAGFGVTLITQRPATLNKDVLAMCEALIVLRTISPQDRKALDAWIVAHDSEGHRAEFMASLASLQRGEAWLWSPGWLDVFQRVQIRQRRTYDSSSTPKAGEKRMEPKRLAPVDIDKLRERMASVVQQAEANDPKKLQARIAQLERENAVAAKQPAPAGCGHEAVIADMQTHIDALKEQSDYYVRRVDVLLEFRSAIESAFFKLDAAPAPPPSLAHRPSVRPKSAPPLPRLPESEKPRTPSTNGIAASAEGLSASQQRILDTLMVLESTGVERTHKSIVAVFAGMSPKSSGYTNNLGYLHNQRGLIHYPKGGFVSLTEQGRAAATADETIATLAGLHEAWYRHVTSSQAAILRVLIGIYPNDLAKPDLAQRAGVSSISSGYTNNLGALRSLGVLDYPSPGRVAATELLFPKGVPA